MSPLLPLLPYTVKLLLNVVPFTAMIAAPNPVRTGVSCPKASTSRAASPSDEPVERIRTKDGGFALVNGQVIVVVASAAKNVAVAAYWASFGAVFITPALAEQLSEARVVVWRSSHQAFTPASAAL